MTQAGSALVTPASRRSWSQRAWAAIAWLAVALPALLLVLASIGALTPVLLEGLPQEPTATLVLLPIVRLCRDIAATLAIGFVLVGGLLAPRPDPRLLRAASVAALSWLLSVLAFIVLTVSELLAFDLGHAAQPVVLASFVTQTTLGTVLVVQLVCAGFVALLGWAVVNRITGAIVLAIALAGACATALTGHSGLHSGHTSATVSLALHIGAAALWVGGLAGTLLLAGRAPIVLARFSTVALVAVIVVGESGLLNASLRLSGPGPLLTTTYGAIVLAKAVALAWLIRVGWLQRTRVVHRVSTGASSVTSGLLLRFAASEFAIMGVALALAVALSRTGAPEGALLPAAVTMGSAAALAVGLGGLVAVLAQRSRTAAGIQALPEVWAIALVAVLAMTTGGGWLPTILGAPIAALLATTLLVLVGSACCLAVATPHGLPAAIIVVIGWAAILVVTANPADPSRVLGATAGCAGILAITVVGRRRASAVASAVSTEAMMDA